MADYATRADVVRALGGNKRLLQLTDYDDTGCEVDDLVDDAIAEAEAEINATIAEIREVPLSPVPSHIKYMSANLAALVLKSRRDALIEADVLKLTNIREWLTNFRNGVVSLGTNDIPAASRRHIPSTTDRATTKDISRDAMKGFS
jgi:phage gp36-like protein